MQSVRRADRIRADTMPARSAMRVQRMIRLDARFSLAPQQWRRESYRLLGRVLICVFIMLSARTRAEVVPDLYAVTVPVAEQSQAELQRAASAGLRELAARISGRSAAANDSNLAPLFANATRYLEQYRYERSTNGGSPWLAQLRFGSALVDSDLRKAGLPIWGGNRPALQTLVVIEDKGTRALIDDSSPLANVLREQWRRRGLVLHLPSHTNASALNVDDVAQLDIAKIDAAAQERADGVLLGRVTVAPSGTCESQWRLKLGAQSLNADATGEGLPTCVATALDQLVDNFSSQYAIAANSSAEGIVLRVTGIVSFDDYAAVLNYLRRLAAIKNTQPILLRNDELLLQLKVEGSTEQLVRQLALESRLTPSENNANILTGINMPLPVTLNYRWAAPQN